MRSSLHPSCAPVLLLLGLLASCRPHEEKTLPEKIREARAPVEDPIPAHAAAYLHEGPAESTQYQGEAARVFRVATRTDKIRKFPCAECHTSSLPSRSGDPFDPRDTSGTGKRKAHWDVAIHHAPAQTMDCRTCHDPAAAMGLRTLRGEPVAYDHSYKLCMQCHFQEARDWSGGAHGKRLGGWAGERVVQNCTGCHNPHQPAFPTRMPSVEMTPSAPEEGHR